MSGYSKSKGGKRLEDDLVILKKAMRIQNYSQATVRAYIGSLRKINGWLFDYKQLYLGDVTASFFLSYFSHLVEKNVSRSSMEISRSALVIFFRVVYNKEIAAFVLQNWKKSTYLPTVLSRSEIDCLLKSIRNEKHWLMIAMLYACGLRVSEVVKLRVYDVDFEKLTLFVRQGKGKKDRLTLLSEKICSRLIEYNSLKMPSDFLFTSGTKLRPLTTRSVQAVFSKALKKSGIPKKASCHSLRHSFATHLLESGVEITYIQKLLGHRSLKTTLRYTKITNASLTKIKSPFS